MDSDRVLHLTLPSCAFDGRDQGSDQPGVAHDDAERCHADQRCAPRESARGERHLRSTSNAESVEVGEDASELSCPQSQCDREEAYRLQVLQAVNEERDAVTGLSSAGRFTACTAASARQQKPKQGATVKIEAWRLVRVRGSAQRVQLQWDHSTDVWQSTTVGPIYSNPEQLASPNAWTRCLRPRGRGRHGDCSPGRRWPHIRKDACSLPSRSALEPSARSLRNNQSPKTPKSSRRLRGMRHSKCDQARAAAC